MFDPSAIALPLRFTAEVCRGTHADWSGHDYSKARPVPETSARLLWGPNDLGNARLTLRDGRLVAIPEIAPPDPKSLLFTVTAVIARVRLGDSVLLSLHPGAVVSLGQPLNDPIELSVSGSVFAYGETVVNDDRFAVRVMSTDEGQTDAMRILGSGSSVFSVILGRADIAGSALSAATEGSVFTLESLVGKPFVGEVDGIPLVTGDIILAGDEVLFRVREVIAGESAAGADVSARSEDDGQNGAGADAAARSEDDGQSGAPAREEKLASSEVSDATDEAFARPGDIAPGENPATGENPALKAPGVSPKIIPFVDPSCESEEKPVSELLEAFAKTARRRRFSSIPVPSIVRLVRGERPQTIAAILSCLPPEDSAFVLAHLPAESVGEVSRRIATICPVKEDSLRGIERILEHKAGIGFFSDDCEPVDGNELLLVILSRCDRFTANWVRLWLGEMDADLASRLFPDSCVRTDSTGEAEPDSLYRRINEDFRALKKEERDRVRLQLSEILKRMEEEDGNGHR